MVAHFSLPLFRILTNTSDRVKSPAKNAPSNVRALLKRESVSLIETPRPSPQETTEETPQAVPSRPPLASNGVGRGFGIAFDPSQVKLRSTKKS